MRRAILLLAAVALTAGCGASETTVGPTTTRAAQPAPPAVSAPSVRPRLRKVLVTVVDGDTGRRVRGAHVRIGRRRALTDATGVAGIPVHRTALPVTISRRGYATRTVRLWFRQHPRSTARIYQPRLQWPMYGAVPSRTQAQTAIRLRPPFHTIWSRGLGSLIEFPAV